MEKYRVILGQSLLTDHDIYLFKEGRHYRLYEKFGSHPGEVAEEAGTHFAVWAPNAGRVCVFGDFNSWNPEAHPLAERQDGSGVFEGFLTGVGAGSRYKYRIVPGDGGAASDRGDPFAFHWELSPRTASVVWDLSHDWQDGAWMDARAKADNLGGPLSIYEMHLGSWRRPGDDPERLLTYREIAELLPDYLLQTGFTHVEF
ncbi:MAG TPA: 1,4-alpha-glucan branching enzyme, partial [Deferrimonas sp.]